MVNGESSLCRARFTIRYSPLAIRLFASPLRPLVPALGAAAAPALVGVDDAHHGAARQQARQEAHQLVAAARDHDTLAGHEPVIAGLRDLVRGAAQQPRRRLVVDAGAQLKLGRDW